ncbi:UNVERIFIED_CONTAM: hypothetical protein Sradi_0485200 [Sesamum radiatum]|uniref:Uncharacterized protein n=1 Tax=Sesamum radiatum TaxID=300843 RepID=A0AAW2W7V4_SESRA
MSFIGAGLFDQFLDVKSLLAPGRKFHCRTFNATRRNANVSSAIEMQELVLRPHRGRMRGVGHLPLLRVLVRHPMVKEDSGRMVV